MDESKWEIDEDEEFGTDVEDNDDAEEEVLMSSV